MIRAHCDGYTHAIVGGRAPCLSVGVKSKAASSSSSVARTGLTEENEAGACHEEEDAAHIYSFGAAKVAWRLKEKLVWPAPDARCKLIDRYDPRLDHAFFVRWTRPSMFGFSPESYVSVLPLSALSSTCCKPDTMTDCMVTRFIKTAETASAFLRTRWFTCMCVYCYYSIL